MLIEKIDDNKLLDEDRYHSCQPDVPDKTASEMKKFMDYVPRHVIIPKVNEIIDKLDTKADSDGVYLKTETYNRNETDNMLSAKANSSNVYTKTETDSLLSDKSNSSDVYTKTEADALLLKKADKTELTQKANSSDVYTKTEADTLLSKKANSSDVYTKVQVNSSFNAINNRLITDFEKDEHDHASGVLYRDGDVFYLLSQEEFIPPDGTISEAFNATNGNAGHLYCCYNNAQELENYINSIGETVLFNGIGSGISSKCVIEYVDGEYKVMLYAMEGSLIFEILMSVSLENWIRGNCQGIDETIAWNTNTKTIEFTTLGRKLCSSVLWQKTDLATKAYVDAQIAKLKYSI